MQVKRLREQPGLAKQAARWFSDKWDIPAEAYLESIGESIIQKTGIPQWYVVLNEQQEIIAGAGVIENDFHDRKDLTPNLCALYVEPGYRKTGVARSIMDHIRQDIAESGLPTLYLVTDLTDFYEKCGWEFLTTVTGDDGQPIRMYTATTR